MKQVKNITNGKKTAERFQKFSKTYYKMHTDAMAGMLDFFFYNEISNAIDPDSSSQGVVKSCIFSSDKL